jgi:phosphate:Na+ symporter
LIKLTPLLDFKDEKHAGSYFHVVNDIERIGDFAKNFYDDASNMINSDYHFSFDAKKELSEMSSTIFEMCQICRFLQNG